MTPELRQYFIHELIRGIDTIGPLFEAFGQRFVDFVVDVPMKHPGLNSEGQPVGHTIDSASEAGDVVAEYSTEADYFQRPYSKIRKDWHHALKLHPQARRILLIGGREAGPKAVTRLTNFAARVKKLRSITLEPYDARRIAEFIVDKLLPNDNAIERLAPFLAPLRKIRDEYAISHSAPEPSAGYVARPDLEHENADQVRADRVAVLAGLSGCGKSEFAAAVVRMLSGEYDTVIWVPASDLRSLNDLKAIDVERRGRKVNLLHLLMDRRCLVVFDDLRVPIPASRFRELCGSGSAALITKQTAEPGDRVLPPLNKEEARRLLEHGISDGCPDDIFELAWSTVGGHPLALKLMNAGVRIGGWSDLREDCASIGEYPDELRPQRLADRLLGRLHKLLKNELAFFVWCGSPRVDHFLARHVLGPLGLRKLKENCLLAADRSDVLRLHDVVYAALPSIGVTADDQATSFEDKLASHIESLDSAQASDLAFLNLRDVHRRKLEQLASQNPDRDAYLFCLLNAWDDAEGDLELIGDPRDRARRATASGSPKDIAVATVLEAVEAIYRKRKHDEGLDAARAFLESHLDVFCALEAAPGLSQATLLRVMHHHAKALRNVQRFDEAVELCGRILRDSPAPETKLLLARLLLHEEKLRDRAKDLLFDLLERAQRSPRDAGLSITLAAIETLGCHQLSQHLRDALARFGRLIADDIIEGAARGFDLAFSAFAGIGRDLQYNDETLFFYIFDRLPDPDVGDVRNDADRAAWGDILLSAAKGVKEDRREHLLREAVAFYLAMEHPKHFNFQQLGQAHVLLGEHEQAARVLEPIVRTHPNPWNRYWLSKAQLAQNDADGALRLVDEALRDEKCVPKYQATLYEQRYEIRKARGDEGAIEDLEKAYATCENEKYRQALEQKLSAARTVVPPAAPPMSEGLAKVYAILGERFDSGETDVAARHNEHQP